MHTHAFEQALRWSHPHPDLELEDKPSELSRDVVYLKWGAPINQDRIVVTIGM